MGNNQNPPIIFRCDFCGQFCEERPSHYKRKLRHFCSTECYANYRRQIMPKEHQNSYKNGGIDIVERKKRVKARSDLNHAVKQKRISKKPCEKCGNIDSQAHHHNYDKPYEIKWLCRECHWLEHKRIHEDPELLEK